MNNNKKYNVVASEVGRGEESMKKSRKNGREEVKEKKKEKGREKDSDAKSRERSKGRMTKKNAPLARISSVEYELEGGGKEEGGVKRRVIRESEIEEREIEEGETRGREIGGNGVVEGVLVEEGLSGKILVEKNMTKENAVEADVAVSSTGTQSFECHSTPPKEATTNDTKKYIETDEEEEEEYEDDEDDEDEDDDGWIYPEMTTRDRCDSGVGSSLTRRPSNHRTVRWRSFLNSRLSNNFTAYNKYNKNKIKMISNNNKNNKTNNNNTNFGNNGNFTNNQVNNIKSSNISNINNSYNTSNTNISYNKSNMSNISSVSNTSNTCDTSNFSVTSSLDLEAKSTGSLCPSSHRVSTAESCGDQLHARHLTPLPQSSDVRGGGAVSPSTPLSLHAYSAGPCLLSTDSNSLPNKLNFSSGGYSIYNIDISDGGGDGVVNSGDRMLGGIPGSSNNYNNLSKSATDNNNVKFNTPNNNNAQNINMNNNNTPNIKNNTSNLSINNTSNINNNNNTSNINNNNTPNINISKPTNIPSNPLCYDINHLSAFQLSLLEKYCILRITSIFEKFGCSNRKICKSLTDKSSKPLNLSEYKDIRTSKESRTSKTSSSASPRAAKYNKKSSNIDKRRESDTPQGLFGLPLEVLRVREGQSLPRCILLAMKHLKRTHKDCEGIFRKPGSKNRVRDLYQATLNHYDAIDYENVCVYDLADLVRLFLKNLPEKLFNKKFTKLAINAFKNIHSDYLQEVLQACLILMPPDHREVAHTLILFLHHLSLRSPLTKMSTTNLALCLTPSLFHLVPPSSFSSSSSSGQGIKKKNLYSKYMMQQKHAQDCLCYLIDNAPTLFSNYQKLLAQSRIKAHTFLQEKDGLSLDTTHSRQCNLIHLDSHLSHHYNHSLCTDRAQELFKFVKENKSSTKGWSSTMHINPESLSSPPFFPFSSSFSSSTSSSSSSSSSNFVEVSFKRMSDDNCLLHLWRTSIIIDAPPTEILTKVLRDRTSWDREVLKWRVLERMGPSTEVFQYVINSLAPHQPRIFTELRSWCTDLPHGSCMLVSQSVDHSKTYSFLKKTRQEMPHSETPLSETRGSFGGVYEGVSCLQSKECIVTATTATAVTNNNKTTTATAETNNTKSTSNTKQELSQKTSTPTSIPNTHPPSPTTHPSSTPNTHQSSSPNTQPNPPTFQSYYNLPSKSLQLLSMIRPEVHACHYVMEPCGAGRTRVTMLSRIDYKGYGLDWYNKVYGGLSASHLFRLACSLKNHFLADQSTPETKV